MTTTMPATVKDAAAAIRKDLKAAFPAVKFSVRVGTGTGRTWIDVEWTDGPDDDMVRDITDRYVQRPVEDVFRERRLSVPVLLAAQDLARTVVPDLTAYDADGKWIADGPGECPVFYLRGWRFGGGALYPALAWVADLLILNPRKGPAA